MKILQVINKLNRGGGAEKFVLELTLALNRIQGVEVDVLNIEPPLNNDFIEIIEKENIKNFCLSKKLRSFGNIKLLRRFIAVGNYDAVHIHLFPSLYYGGLVRSHIKNKCNFVYTEHNTSNRRRKNIIFQLADSIIYRKYDRIVAISDQVKSNLSYHLHYENIDIVNNGIDIAAINNTIPTNIYEELGLQKNITIVTMVSRITQGKDHNTLIRAIETLPDNFHLVIVGDGPLKDSLKDFSEKSTASHRIHMLGLRKDVYGILKSSDIIVLSSEHEGFSIAMLEAMAARKPFVASAVQGIKDLVSGVAELFDYQNYKQLASILFKLEQDKIYYDSVVNRCSNFAKQYDINKIAHQYLELYR